MCCFCTLRKQLADNAYKSYHFYKVIVVLRNYRVSKNKRGPFFQTAIIPVQNVEIF